MDSRHMAVLMSIGLAAMEGMVVWHARLALLFVSPRAWKIAGILYGLLCVGLLAFVPLPLALVFCLFSGTTILMGLIGAGTPAMRERIAEQHRDDDELL